VLSAADVADIDAAAVQIPVAGDRYRRSATAHDRPLSFSADDRENHLATERSGATQQGMRCFPATSPR
jgi:hypothetical protein